MPTEKLALDYSMPKTLCLKLSGDWRISAGLPAIGEITAELAAHKDIAQVTFDVSETIKWDSGFVSFLLHLVRECEHKNIQVIREGLPPGVEKLLALALTVSEKNIPRKIVHESFLERVGGKALQIKDSTRTLLNFLGDITLSFGRLIRGKAYFRRSDLLLILQKCGADALPLVSLISMLVGMILAFVGVIQLQLFGAQIFIADIVGIGMVRVMGAVMTGILMAGRTGASFAAELGIMQVNEEVDALKTLGVAPVEFLVMPRVLALLIMMPLLTIFSDLMGILGGFIVSIGMLDLNPIEYLTRTRHAVKLNNLWVGLVHSFAFGIIIAITGCLRGMNCQRSADGLGEATTSAVVTGITGIVIATAIITFVCQVLRV